MITCARLARFVALALLTAAPALAQDTGWTITSFQSRYTVRPDRKIDVVERIEVDFGGLQRHGIYREIPVKYRKVARVGIPVRAGTVETRLSVERVTDGEGRTLPTEIKRGNRVRIRIGDPDHTVTGKQTYVLHYRLSSGLGFFDDHDELYWQVTGTGWPVPILRASATVNVVSRSAPSDGSGWSAWCYAGLPESSSSERCTAKVTGPGEYSFTSRRLDRGEGLTMVAAFPKGIVPPPTSVEWAVETAAIWWPTALPVMTFLAMFTLWWTRGREPSAGSIVPVWRPPEGLPPGAAGTLVDQRADMKDVVATLIDLAVRGYIQIREVPAQGLAKLAAGNSLATKALRSVGLARADWVLERTQRMIAAGDLTPFEMSVFTGVLEGESSRKMSDLRNDFYVHLPRIRKGMYEYLVQKGLFRRSPESVRRFYSILGTGIILGGIFLAAGSSNWILLAGMVLSGIVVLAFRSAMPAMTLEGARRWREIKGLEEYIRRAEKIELEYAQAPERTTNLFEILLPYAVALNVSDIWLKQFAPILAASPPSWYTGSTPGSFDAGHFQSGLSEFRESASHTMGSAPGSSSGSGGGGSVGGGGGGGGGGSW
jgi:uncharacterized membrane protein YgcG